VRFWGLWPLSVLVARASRVWKEYLRLTTIDLPLIEERKELAERQITRKEIHHLSFVYTGGENQLRVLTEEKIGWNLVAD